ncbi:class I SAM-dependent methyltransferase [Alkalihalobacillus sp. LMS39]|uniref:class I SAM-dependent methyltransferase n=1 Tax=Alkalihalobacillus sp. LMS39 TaxID=2924032 RepID=UPI001FB4DBC5|nr:class I SAM-dependent methyltransferase [Alkalihalobacillus sp. LMS39]UOE95595.1 class I SAM-dependent methyltransferase [Alkalihalobacillus sp. LMS39]
MLENTGERIIPNMMKTTNGMLLEHVARYYFSSYYAKGRLLDIACGTGYGTKMLATSTTCSEIIGVDLSHETIRYAKANYAHPLISFHQGDGLSYPFLQSLGTFDTVVSFETIEHIHDDETFVHHLHSILAPGGTLIMSTPFGQGRGMPTLEPFHVHQLTKKEFQSMFSAFSTTELFAQRGMCIEPERNGVHYPIGVIVCIK